MKAFSAYSRIILVMALVGLLWSTKAEAQIPRTISYQGVLCDAAGQPKPDNTYQMTFRLYELESGGSTVWTQQVNVAVKRGLFSTLLGPFGLEVSFDRAFWLGIQLDGEAELSPRIPLSSVGHSFSAMKADTSKYALEIKDGAVTSAKVAPVQLVKSINTLKDDVTIQAGSNITIGTSGNTLTIAASSGTGGTITGITTQAPLSGGGSSGLVTIAMNDLGITSSKLADGAVTSAKIADGSVVTSDLAASAVTTAQMSASGSSSGQVLTSNGASVIWGSASGPWQTTGSNIYYNSGYVGVGTSAPSSRLQVTNGSVLFSGTTGGTPVSGAGTRLMWIPAKYAFRAGYVEGDQWDDGNVGIFSTAMGRNTVASGERATSLGGGNTASGNYSTALGNASVASGAYSIAAGSTATASGDYSTAIGRQTTASGAVTTALGFNVGAGMNGSFIIGDYSAGNYTTTNKLNEFMGVFAGGYTLYTTRSWNQGVYMNGGTSGWTNISDRNRKENFRPVDGELLLGKIRLMPITEWNYKGGDPAIRYMGPVAQDFYAAFHLGGTDSLGINSICIDGVNMAAIQALEKRTAELKERTTELQTKTAELDMIKKELTDLKACVTRLETALKSSKNFAER